MQKEKIYISDDLHDKCLRLQKKSYEGEIGLLGKNKNNICVEVLCLNSVGGCPSMPEIDSSDITDAVLEFERKGLSPGGFLYISHPDYGNPNWGGDHGSCIWDHSGVIFLQFIGTDVCAQISNKSGEIRNIEVAVVNKDFGKRKLTKKVVRRQPVKRKVLMKKDQADR